MSFDCASHARNSTANNEYINPSVRSTLEVFHRHVESFEKLRVMCVSMIDQTTKEDRDRFAVRLRSWIIWHTSSRQPQRRPGHLSPIFPRSLSQVPGLINSQTLCFGKGGTATAYSGPVHPEESSRATISDRIRRDHDCMLGAGLMWRRYPSLQGFRRGPVGVDNRAGKTESINCFGQRGRSKIRSIIRREVSSGLLDLQHQSLQTDGYLLQRRFPRHWPHRMCGSSSLCRLPCFHASYASITLSSWAIPRPLYCMVGVVCSSS
jgi:hypothetical protein